MGMDPCKPRIVGALVGDIWNEPSAKTKYGHFFQALAESVSLLDVYDASLQGGYRYLNALLTFHPNQKRWRESFYKNVAAFRLRSRLANQYLRQLQPAPDMIVQVGVLFDSRWESQGPPSIIYTDYTAHLTAQGQSFGRSPFSDHERQQWLALEREAFRRASHICTRSQLVRQSIVDDYGIDSGKISVIGGGVNFAQLPTPVVARETERPTILFIGKELQRKGGDVLLAAFAMVRECIPGARLIMVTSGPLPSSSQQAGVEVVEPTWEREAIAELYLAADVFVLPSRLETWGDVLLEAMSFALPCIGVRGQAMDEIIEHDYSGLLVPAEDVSALAASLLRLLTDYELRVGMGRRARQRAEESFNWSDVVERLRSCMALVDGGVGYER